MITLEDFKDESRRDAALNNNDAPTFTNNSLASGPLSGNTLTLKATLSVTTDGAGSGFYGGLIIGDPTGVQKNPDAQTHSFVQAMAGLGAGAGAHAVLASDAVQARPPMLAVSHLAQFA